MNKTRENKLSNMDKLLVTTEHLQELLDCGKQTAVQFGHEARAMVKQGRRIFWRVDKIIDYLDEQ